ncbi:MAG TPA: M1 family aminopeptidase, partial [Saprospiraceae bacterium]
WFGDKVTCGSWTEIWLNEGFATYLTGMTYERFSPDEFWPLWKLSASNSATSQPGGSVFVDDTTSVNRIFSGRLTYNKGAYLLHMLRWITGDDAFFAACRDYLELPGTAYDFGSTQELQGYLEQRSGKDLDGFFADWYYGQGFPTYDVHWNQQADSLVIWLGQTQSHPSVSFFEMPVPISATINGTPETFVLNNTTQDQRFSFFIGDATVDSIDIDPEIWLLSGDNTISEISTAVHGVTNNEKFILYPNPANESLNVIPGQDFSKVTFTNTTGIQWHENIISGKIDVSHLPSGFYTLTLQNDEQEILCIKPVIIHH